MKIILIAAALLALAGCAGTPTVQQGPGAEITYDGLHRVDNAKSQKVWIKPEIDLSRYDKLMVESAGIEYRHAKATSRYDRNADSFPLDEKQKARFEESVREVFTEELSKLESFTLTDEPGPGVLKITAALIDVVSKIPPDIMSARSSVYLNDLGAATLVLELSDSRTNEALARVADRRNVEPVVMQESTSVTNAVEVKRSMRVWGSRIRTSLDDLHALGCYICSVPGTSAN